MKRLLASFILIGILVQSGTQLCILANFYLQQEYIAQNLCENRDQPEKGCAGKCCLVKELEKDNKSSKQQASNLKDKGVQLLAVDGCALAFKTLNTLIIELGAGDPNDCPSDFSSCPFQPPKRI